MANLLTPCTNHGHVTPPCHASIQAHSLGHVTRHEPRRVTHDGAMRASRCGPRKRLFCGTVCSRVTAPLRRSIVPSVGDDPSYGLDTRICDPHHACVTLPLPLTEHFRLMEVTVVCHEAWPQHAPAASPMSRPSHSKLLTHRRSQQQLKFLCLIPPQCLFEQFGCKLAHVLG